MRFLKLLLLFLAFPSVSSLSAQSARVPGELLAQFKPGTDPVEIVKKYGVLQKVETGIALGRLRSKPMNIYSINYNEEAIAGVSLLSAMKSDKDITLIQFNHIVSKRETLSDDPGLTQQWHHINNGQNSATDDADIDSDLAWDITTGGVTATGDTIVVCIIEGGNLNHPDLKDNAWFNYNEIPDNGLDDDGNGYVDDFRGWNVFSEDDAGVYMGSHGTNVMGMIGAKGDNAVGVVGANWNVKMMSVSGESVNDEASVVEAYTYPLIQRQLYNSTNGLNGAFVVVTNASWGIDYGDPDDVPIWSAFYDTLGTYGILSCGATANNNVNIDVVGDIPTGVSSPYMISVTATNVNDMRTFSGFGIETVDLGAPGEDVYTTAGDEDYTYTSGTSFASPLTAGVVALLYSAPCEALALLAQEHPQLAADYVREMLFQGVDPIENLEFEVKTGGRLNAFNSLVLLMNNCSEELCINPFSFNTTLSNDTSYNFQWVVADSQEVVLRFRELGSSDWTTVYGLNEGNFLIDTLAYCSDYEFQVASDCSGNADDLNFGSSLLINTKGCCIAPTIAEVSVLSANQAALSWITDFAIDSYDVLIKVTGTDDYNLIDVSTDGSYLLTGLDACTSYTVLIRPSCITGFEVGASLTFLTKGCGSCIDSEFCLSYAESSDYEFIEQISVGTFTNASGNNGGYALFDTTGIELAVGASYNIVLSPGFSGFMYSEFFRVWIDLDQDGSFSNSELLFSSEQGSNQEVEGELLIPVENITLGNTRMRIAMKYVGGWIPDDVAACEVYSEGETEDYCITLTEPLILTDRERGAVRSISLFPNPGDGNFTVSQVDLEDDYHGNSFLHIWDVTGKQVEVFQISGPNTRIETHLSSGMYIYIFKNKEGKVLDTGKLIIEQ